MADDIDQNGCPYTKECFNFYYNDPGSYKVEGSDVLPTMKDKIVAAFNLTKKESDSFTYNQFYFYGDILMAEDKEGDQKRDSFSEEEWYYIRNSQKTVLAKGLSGDAKPLFGTKFFRKPY